MANSKYELNQKLPDIPYCLFYDRMGRYVPSHWHREIEVVMCTEGTVKMAINNVTYELQKGDVVVIPDGSTHLYYNSQGNERMVVFLDYRFFKKYSGETFMNYLNAYRINKARDMLFLDSRNPVSRISELVGIPNVKTFNRLFRQITGTSPTQYRKSATNMK